MCAVGLFSPCSQFIHPRRCSVSWTNKNFFPNELFLFLVYYLWSIVLFYVQSALSFPLCFHLVVCFLVCVCVCVCLSMRVGRVVCFLVRFICALGAHRLYIPPTFHTVGWGEIISPAASIFRVRACREREAVDSSETLILICQTARRHMPEVVGSFLNNETMLTCKSILVLDAAWEDMWVCCVWTDCSRRFATYWRVQMFRCRNWGSDELLAHGFATAPVCLPVHGCVSEMFYRCKCSEWSANNICPCLHVTYNFRNLKEHSVVRSVSPLGWKYN